jgi:predicted DsbA family dithiol-disulfide isomerase
MPEEGISRKEYRTKKFGSWERSQELDAKVIAVGETEGIHFAFDRIERTRTPSTPTASSGWRTSTAFKIQSWAVTAPDLSGQCESPS